MGMNTPLGLKSKTFNQAHLHHHLGQNRPHQKTITHPHGPPQRRLNQIANFWVGVRAS